MVQFTGFNPHLFTGFFSYEFREWYRLPASFLQSSEAVPFTGFKPLEMHTGFLLRERYRLPAYFFLS